MDNFNAALTWILKAEGGYVDDPDDPGGATNKGVTQEVYDDFRLDHGLALNPVRKITDQEVSDIYRSCYWDPAECGMLPAKTAVCVMDFAVNSGVGVAVKHLQKIVGAKQDGILGPKTIALILGFRDDALATKYLDDHAQFYENVIQQNPRRKKFEHGWLNRIAELRSYISKIK